MRYLVRIAIVVPFLVVVLLVHTFTSLWSYGGAPATTRLADEDFAYVFYATTNLYACSALVNIHRLRHLFQTRHPTYLLVSADVSAPYRATFEEDYGVTIIEHEPPPLVPGGAPYYRDVMLKLIGFKLHHWAPRLRRIILLDSDQLVLQSLDHLFTQVPEDVEVAAPNAYWLLDEPIATSAMMVVSLSEPLWQRLNHSLTNLVGDTYDMDLINAEFKDDMMLLPGNYVTLNSHWEVNEIPSWSAFRNDNTKWPPEGKKALPRISSITSSRKNHRPDNKPPAASPTGPTPFIFDPGLVDPLTSIFNDNVYVLHFTAFGKPWSGTVQNVHQFKPKAHPLFAEQFLLWRSAAKHICPALSSNDTGAREISGKRYSVEEFGGGRGEVGAPPHSDRFLDEI